MEEAEGCGMVLVIVIYIIITPDVSAGPQDRWERMRYLVGEHD